MTQAEFKAWFEGFTEALEGLPNKAQWKRIKDRVKEIDGKEITERVYIDRYVPSYFYYNPHRYWPSITFGAEGISPTFYNGTQMPGTTYSSTDAMYALGKADLQTTLSG